MALEKAKMKEECPEPVYKMVANAHLSTNAYAPDLVKWTKKDLEKILKDKAKPSD